MLYAILCAFLYVNSFSINFNDTLKTIRRGKHGQELIHTIFTTKMDKTLKTLFFKSNYCFANNL